MSELFHRGRHKATQRGTGGRELEIQIERLADSTLKVTLSDDVDPSFLCVVIVTRCDYEEMKKSQGLLIDFDSFPAQLVRLLQQCENTNLFLSLNQDGPLNLSLEVIERNEFKRLVHLSLKLSPASDLELKKYMSENVLKLRKIIDDLQSTIMSKDSMNNEKQRSSEMKLRDLSNSLARVNTELITRESEFQDVLKKERDRFHQEKLEFKKSLESCSQNQTSSLKETIVLKDKQLEETSLRCRQMQDTIKMMESQISDKTQRLMSVEKQLHTIKVETDSLKKQHGLLDRDIHDKDQALQQTKNRFVDTEKALQDKANMLRDALDSLHSLKKEKIALEERVIYNETIATKKSLELQDINEQLVKANQIIAKQNADILELREKLMCRTAIALEQEKIINSNSGDMTKFRQNEKQLKDEIEQHKRMYEMAQEDLRATKKLLEDKAEIIKNNNSVIQWLHRKIDAMQSINELTNSAGRTVTSSTPYSQYHRESDDKESEADEINDNRLSDLYTAGLRDEETKTKLTHRRSEDTLHGIGSIDKEHYSIDPVYLKPSSYSSTKASTRSKSQESVPKKVYAPLPNLQSATSKDSRKSMDSKSNKKNNAAKSVTNEKRYLKSGISAYFPNA